MNYTTTKTSAVLAWDYSPVPGSAATNFVIDLLYPNGQMVRNSVPVGQITATLLDLPLGATGVTVMAFDTVNRLSGPKSDPITIERLAENPVVPPVTPPVTVAPGPVTNLRVVG